MSVELEVGRSWAPMTSATVAPPRGARSSGRACTCGARVIAQSVAWPLPGDRGRAVELLEHTALGADGVVVRYGQFFGPGTYYPVTPPGPPRIHVDEAARRTVTLLEAPSGIGDVVDDSG